MYKLFCKVIFATCALLMFGCKTLAQQQFQTHAVKEGETLESVAKHYKVTPYNIIKYNKELKQGEALQPNTILVIPVGAVNTVSPQPTSPDAANKQPDVVIVHEEPIGFTKHRVKKKETLYGIGQRYHITEGDIKRYNKELYSTQLKKGMVLTIPKYLRVRTEENVIDEDDFEKYSVQPKETRWSIANKYGISVDSLKSLNPEMGEILSIGQELNLPKLPGSTVEDQEIQLYSSYTVPPKQTFYSLEKKMGVTEEQVKALNPEVQQRGLQEGMVIRLPNKKADTTAVNTDNFIFYEVKPKQTEYSLTRNLGVTYAQLIALNPDLKAGLKAGMVLKIPKSKQDGLEVKNSLILDKINLLDSIDILNRPKLVFLLPFRANNIDLSNKENAVETIVNRTSTRVSLGLYTGALIALDSIKKLGVSVDVRTYDTQLDIAKVKEILLNERLNSVSAIIGPLDAKSLDEVAFRAANYQVPVIAPVTSNSDISLSNVFFTIPTDMVLRSKMLDYMGGVYTDQNIIVIADDNNKPVEAQILSRFPSAKTVQLKENLSLDIAKFTDLLSQDVENWVFLETGNFKVISSVSSILNSSISEDVKVRMFTTNKNKAFDNDVISSVHLSNLRFTYPSVDREMSNDSFVRSYRNRFGMDPDRYAIRGFDVTYDALLKLAYKNNLFEASKVIGKTEYSGNKFDYHKDLASGYFNTACYILMYDAMHIKEVKENGDDVKSNL
ncbi:LysM peptidoglycan-binding domain-containing protein [Flavobacteriaceae bacterium F89]|uniref:LysM peptidoglycan-binding domain-containing protein n=1 Tax=Cerina litoralis TaxID=2874477 RepID=A0AAE3JNB5_9FLAO|nr:LysM peptidoglycan-binding domain-containing protein [Cerina litoralis]MCG2459704.1 LysM peptidoglycan-binding domain-containing protein [Cerina litoralis]